HAGLPFLCLELVDGCSLDRFAGGGPWPPAAAARLVETLAQAMHYAHQQGVVHRDLKPANVLLQKSEVRSQRSEVRGPRSDESPRRSVSADLCPLTSDLCPKIADFGLAKLLDGGQAPVATQSLLGTPNYMAPEQASAT